MIRHVTAPVDHRTAAKDALAYVKQATTESMMEQQ